MKLYYPLLLSIFIIAIAAFLGLSLSGFWGALIAVLLSGSFLYYHFVFFEEIILKAHKAKDIRSYKGTSSSFFGLNELASKLAFQLGMPQPTLYYTLDPSPLIFSVGRTKFRHKIILSSGLLALLQEKELEAVLIHEFVRNERQRVFVGNYFAVVNYSLLRLFIGSDPRELVARHLLGLIFSPILWLSLNLGRRSEKNQIRLDQAVVQHTHDRGSYCGALRRIHSTMSQDSTRPLSLRLAMGPLYIVDPMAHHPWGVELGFFRSIDDMRLRVNKLMHAN